jgi:hypothetical protein
MEANRMIRFAMFAALLAFVFSVPSFAGGFIDHRWGTMRFVTPKPAFPKAKNGIVTLWYMPGGVEGEHFRWAKVWLDRGYRMELRDDQYSAAAMMVLWFKHRGGKVCAHKGADLHFHTPNNRNGVEYFGPSAAKIIGNTPRYGWKRIAPKAFGIPRCK